MRTSGWFAPGTRAARIRAIAGLEFRTVLLRPLTLVWLGLTFLFVFAAAQEGLTLVRSGDSATGGVMPYQSGEIAFASFSAMIALLVHTFFVAIASGLSPIRDDEARVNELLFSTPLSPGEYVWGKFAGLLSALLLVVTAHVGMAVLLNHVLPLDGAKSPRGPLVWGHYLRPFVLFLVPYVLFLSGTTFFVGARARQPVLIFALPLTVILLLTMLLGNNADEAKNSGRIFLEWLDPTGLRWLTRTYLQTDRGVAFYNTAVPDYTPTFLFSRLLFAGAGLGFIGAAQAFYERAARGKVAPLMRRARRSKKRDTIIAEPMGQARTVSAPLSALQMRSRQPGVFKGMWAVARAEIGELLRQPGLYLFVPLLVLFISVGSNEGSGKYPADRLPTAGQLAAQGYDTVGIFGALLLLAYTVETLERDRATRLAGLLYSLPTRTVSLIGGKFLALQLVAVLPALAALFVLVLRVAFAGMPVTLAPFGLLWGVLLWPALATWVLFIMAVYALSGHKRYSVYAFALLALSLLTLSENRGGWLTNLFLRDNAVPWTDLAPLEADHIALVWSRLYVVALGLLFGAVAVRGFRRRDTDVARMLGRRRFGTVFVSVLPVLPFALFALTAFVVLFRLEQNGPEGVKANEAEKRYWKRNFATFRDAPVPGLSDVQLTIDFTPEKRAWTARGVLTLTNATTDPMPLLPLTGNREWKNVRWTLNGKAFKPLEREGLFVFRPDVPLGPGAKTQIGFSYDRPDPGPTRGGGSRMEFLVPSAVVLTSFAPSFLPQPGYDPDRGVNEDNQFDLPDYQTRYEPKKQTPPLFGSRTPFTLRATITAPNGFLVNCAGESVKKTEANGRTTTVWESRVGLRAFNLVGGRKLQARRGEQNTVVYYYRGHQHNVKEIGWALDAARKHYSKWYGPLQTRELRLTEFPALADYAQGFAGNISFSEGIGFLTATNDAANNAWAITAHESAHQWWGNIVVPGDGPGGNVVSEGMAEFSAALLLTAEKGENGRQSFLRDLERAYTRKRVKDSEEPLARMSGGKSGSVVVTYQRGGWVFWMLMDQVMGRDAMLTGLRDFLNRYRSSPNHPVLDDLLHALREHASNRDKFDAFANVWFYDTSLPQFTLSDVKAVKLPNAEKRKHGGATWKTTARLCNVGTGTVGVTLGAMANFNPTNVSIKPFAPGDAGTPVTLYTEAKPETLTVDPDVNVLQTGRDAAEVNVL